ncbi:hypothetical protein [Pseudalkalibacillus caeni]|uniref:Uncharacterized protein n=1 Tax=Exobacillus caeni TaxID=2574798 RepID=A0A5R9F0V7_9BACL|nr:hypothetical protein [Pseudalkalibacillus caeni]TLS36066.1 hypothetical protein FCL54_16885 [Pseudalkalibacillus caeni]
MKVTWKQGVLILLLAIVGLFLFDRFSEHIFTVDRAFVNEEMKLPDGETMLIKEVVVRHFRYNQEEFEDFDYESPWYYEQKWMPYTLQNYLAMADYFFSDPNYKKDSGEVIIRGIVTGKYPKQDSKNSSVNITAKADDAWLSSSGSGAQFANTMKNYYIKDFSFTINEKSFDYENLTIKLPSGKTIDLTNKDFTRKRVFDVTHNLDKQKIPLNPSMIDNTPFINAETKKSIEKLTSEYIKTYKGHDDVFRTTLHLKNDESLELYLYLSKEGKWELIQKIHEE